MRIIAFLILLIGITAQAQAPVKGIVKDSKTNTPLAFATIIPQNGKTTVTDVDGRFVIENKDNITHFTVTYTGYEPQVVQVDGKKSYKVSLRARSEEMNELVISSVNPAKELIKLAIKAKKDNDPQKKLNSYRYKTYDRLVVTANPDSIAGVLDSIFIYEKVGRRFEKIDSSDFKFKKMIEKQHLYQTEKVSEFIFNKEQGLKENVLATRMAGFKQPLYEIIALKLQSYSVYNDIDLVETKYAGPLANDALSEYSYRILDTVTIDNRETYMVYFTPKRVKKKYKLEGILYLDSATYGIAQAVYRVKNVMDVTASHFFKYEKDLDLWFPDSKTLKIVKGNNKDDIKILGETIKFDAVDKDLANRKKEASDFVYLLSESSNFDKEFNIPLTIKHASVAIEIKQAATSQPESYWNQFRTDTLDSRSIKTYAALDSLITKENWEQRIILGRNILNGYLPLGPVNLDLRQVIKYNVHEGIRLGLGGITNDKFSKIFRISGYGAYGTKDGRFKYSLGAALRVGNFSNSWIGASYTDDIREIASTSFATDKRRFKIYDSRPLNVSTFYNYQSWEGYIESRLLAKTDTRLQLTRTRVDPRFDYIFRPGNGNEYTVYNLTTATASLQWNPFSDFMQTPTGRVEIEKRFPQFAFQFTHSIAGILDSDFTFSKMDFRTVYEKKYLNGQKTSFLLQTGIAVGDTPLTHLYSAQPNNRDKESVLARLRFAGKNSFETMYFNEFFSSQYVILQAKHGLGKYTLFNKVKLAPVVVTRFAWGNMEDKADHEGIEFNTLEKGYYESGLELNEIYKVIGITAFYRYGPYHLPEFSRNISLKVSITLNLF
jgi:hypothetical protein